MRQNVPAEGDKRHLHARCAEVYCEDEFFLDHSKPSLLGSIWIQKPENTSRFHYKD